MARSSLPLRLSLVALVVLPACGEDADAVRARDAFDAFQNALFAADRPALRRLVTRESLPAIEHLPLESLGGKSALDVHAVERRTRGRFDLSVSVTDAAAVYVVVRENGQWCVDLLESLRSSNAHEARPGYSIVPAGLSAAEIGEIRATQTDSMR